MRAQRPIVALTIFLGWITAATAEDFPSRPITMVVPFSAGGPTDTLARSLADRMQATLGQPVIVENVTGAAGNIGVARVVHAAPNGYTVSIGNWTSHVVNGAVYELSYDLLKDLTPIALLPNNLQLLVSKSAVPAKDLKELIAWVKLNQATISAGTGGAGTAAHIGGVYFQKITGTSFQFVPYRAQAQRCKTWLPGTLILCLTRHRKHFRTCVAA